MIKARWVHTIYKALQARAEFAEDSESVDETEELEEALEYFKDLELDIDPKS